MSKDHVAGETRDQSILFPDTLDEYVTEENPVRFIDAFVDSLDLERLGFKHAKLDGGAGRPPYDPSDLLKLYVYGYLNQVRSSRKLERECHRNIEVIWLMRKLTPDFKTIADFRKENIDCIKPVFKEFVYLCRSLDLFGAELIGIDGSKFRAVNSRKRNLTEERLAEVLKRLDEKIARYLKELEENDGAADDEKRRSGGSGTEKLKEKLAKLEERKREYVQAQDLMKETGQKEVSLTDPDSRLMKNNGKLDVCYTAEAAVDSKNKMVVDYEVTNNPSDQGQLGPMAESAKEALDVERLDATADRGFFNGNDIKRCLDSGITPYVPEPSWGGRGGAKKTGVPAPEFYEDRFTYDGATNSYTCPAGQTLSFVSWNNNWHGMRYRLYQTDACFSCPYFMTRCTKNKTGRMVRRWEHEGLLEEMRARLRTADGLMRVRMRRELCEHPFGTMKRAFNQGYFLMKELRKVKGEMGFTMLAFNMRRAISILGVKALRTHLALK